MTWGGACPVSCSPLVEFFRILKSVSKDGPFRSPLLCLHDARMISSSMQGVAQAALLLVLLTSQPQGHASPQGLTSTTAPVAAPAPEGIVPYQNNLNTIVPPSPVTDNGTDWCMPFKPCNRTSGASIESSYSLGLAPVAGVSAPRSSAYRYASINPPSAVDWRRTLTPWPVRNQQSCGKQK